MGKIPKKIKAEMLRLVDEGEKNDERDFEIRKPLIKVLRDEINGRDELPLNEKIELFERGAKGIREYKEKRDAVIRKIRR